MISIDMYFILVHSNFCYSLKCHIISYVVIMNSLCFYAYPYYLWAYSVFKYSSLVVCFEGPFQNTLPSVLLALIHPSHKAETEKSFKKVWVIFTPQPTRPEGYCHHHFVCQSVRLSGLESCPGYISTVVSFRNFKLCRNVPLGV